MKWWKKSFVFLFKNLTRIHDEEKEKKNPMKKNHNQCPQPDIYGHAERL
jgi:hypothetical protein